MNVLFELRKQEFENVTCDDLKRKSNKGKE